MRARRLLAFFGVVALAVAALVVLRSGDSEPTPDGVGSVNLQPNAPLALRAPGSRLAHAHARSPTSEARRSRRSRRLESKDGAHQGPS
jgi:hypothetical protein